MKISLLSIPETKQTEITFFNVIILLYLGRISVPLFKFPFLALFIIYSIYILVKNYDRIGLRIFHFLRNYIIILLSFLTLILSFFLSNKLYLLVFKDIISSIILLALFFIASFVISSKNDLKYFFSNQIQLIVLFAVIISILGIFDLLGVFSLYDYSHINGGTGTDPIRIDENFAQLPVLFGFIIILSLLRKELTRRKILKYNLLLLLFSFHMVFSGSRRLFFVFIIICFILFVRIIMYREGSIYKTIIINSRYFIISFIIIISFFSYTFFFSGYGFRTSVLKTLGSNNIEVTKSKFSIRLYRYAYIFGYKKPSHEFYRFLWPILPEDPDSGWGIRKHKTIFPLEGKNVEIVPRNAKGYLQDSTCESSYYPNNDVCESYTLVKNFDLKKGEGVKSYVYCFVSDSFDVDVAALSVKQMDIDEGRVTGKPFHHYDLAMKGTWQKLEIEFTCNIDSGSIPVFMSFYKRGIESFIKQSGHIIFAYPVGEKIANQENVSYGVWGNSKYSNFKYFRSYSDHPDRKENYSSLFNFNLVKLQVPIEKDPIRRFASILVSEDTAYLPYKTQITLNKISDSFIRERLSRWEFAVNLYIHEFNWNQRLFGGGFSFLNWYGYYFFNNKTKSDYPHNPFLSVLLYSGLAGLIIYFFLLIKTFTFYRRYYLEYPLWTIFFGITLFFSFFSAGTPLDPPTMGFFVILPFFIHYIHKKDDPNS